MQKKIEKTNEIQVTDETGKHFMIDELTTFSLFTPLSGPANWVNGARAYEMNGEHCNQIDANTWKTLNSGRILRRV